MERDRITAEYLDEVRRSGATAAELIGTQPDSELLNAYYQGRYLSRPLFLGADERARLETDLDNLRSALLALPDRLYDGDLAAFARAVGMTDAQVSAIMRSRGGTVTRQARADLYRDASGFRLLELNMGSALAGIDSADMCRALLAHPVLAKFAERHGLGYVDTMREVANNFLVECGYPAGSYPMVAFTDWPSSYETLAPYMRTFAVRWRELGLDAHPCHVGELEFRGGRVWLRGRAVDIVGRLFMIEDLLESPEAPAVLDPLLDAAARGEVRMFTPLDAAVFSSKGALAMLSDEKHRGLFTAAELDSLDRILPWTRMVRPGPVALEDGRRVDLLTYALAHQDDLALKPTLLHGGHGVLLGWQETTSPRLWHERLTEAMGGPYVIQRRIRPVPELFADDDGEPVPWIPVWGVFTVVNGYGGAFIRATRADSDIAVINMGSGAFAGCCLHVRPEETK